MGAGVGPLSRLSQFINNNFLSNKTIRFNNGTDKWFYSGPGTGKLSDTFFQAEPWDYSNHSLSTYGLI